MKSIDELISLCDHKNLALFACDCAERVLNVFESENPQDERPKKAIEAGRAWVRGELKVTPARKTAFAAHAAARYVISKLGCAAARSAGHAAATAHVATHAIHAANYAVKATVNDEAERDWQYNRLLEIIKIKNENNKKAST